MVWFLIFGSKVFKTVCFHDCHIDMMKIQVYAKSNLFIFTKGKPKWVQTMTLNSHMYMYKTFFYF